jgi:hypothetical protein
LPLDGDLHREREDRAQMMELIADVVLEGG